MMRPRELTVAHEAAHVVARYILGTLGHVDLVELPANGNAGGGASARVSTTRTVGDVIRTRTEAEKEIVSTLAGCAAMRALGLDDGGGEADELMAGTIAVEFTDGDVDASVEMYDSCLERAERLVGSPRFQDLLVRLCVSLEAVPAMSGDRAQELLRSWDPDAVVYRQPDYTFSTLADRYARPGWAEQKLALRPRGR